MTPVPSATRAQVLLAWAPALAYMALIFVLSSFQLQTPVIERLPFKDKLVHFVEYAVLGALCAHATLRTWPERHWLRTTLLGAFLAAAFGVTDELHQSFVPGRDADVLDIVADTLGGAVGAMVSAAYALRRGARKENSESSSGQRAE